MEQVMLLDGLKGTALALAPTKKDLGAIIGGIFGVGVLGFAAFSVYRSVYPYRGSARPSGRSASWQPSDRGDSLAGSLRGRRRRPAAHRTSRPTPHDDGTITLFTQRGCQHCKTMRAALKTAKNRGMLRGFTVREEDASSSPSPLAQTINQTPSIHVRPSKAGRGRTFTATQLTNRLDEWTPAAVAGLITTGRAK